MSKYQTLTVAQAKEQGYTHCTPKYDEMRLIELDNCDFKQSYVLVEKEGKPFQIAPDTILDILNDYLDSQDEVDNESGLLNELAASIDYSEITNKLNDLFVEKTHYYFPSKIDLIQ